MLLRVDNLHEKKKNITESHQGRRNFESVRAFARAIFVICTRVTTLHSCCMRMHSCSANQKRVIFSCTLLVKKKKCALKRSFTNRSSVVARSHDHSYLGQIR